MSVDLIVRDARLRGSADSVDIAVDDCRITAVGPALELDASTVVDADGSLVVPGFVNAHQHLDKTLLGDEFRLKRWDGTMGALREVNDRHRLTYTVESILERAEQVVELAITHGTTAMRAFTDIEPTAGTTGTRALVELRERYRGELEMQVSPFPQNLLFGRGDNSRLFEEAIAAGADVVGGMPSDEPTPELVHRHVDFCLDLAKRNGLDVHMLIDDTDDPSPRALEYLAWRTIQEGMEGRVTCGHAGALSSYDHSHAAMVIDRVREAGISMCVNSHISLTLQGRHDVAPVRRGTTRVGELLRAGVNVLAAQDDVDDPYYPLGRADLLEVAQYTAHVCHLIWPEELETVADMVTVNASRAMRLEGYGTAVGDRADLVVLGRPTLRDALSDMPPRRAVISGGRLIAETLVEVRRHRVSA